MRVIASTCVLAMLAGLFLAAPAQPQEVSMTAVQFPEGRRIAVDFARRPPAPQATLTAEVAYQGKQSRITVSFKRMRPAVLYGGDVTSYVLWAVTPDGRAENLGEIWVEDSNGKSTFATGLKNFGMLVTAERYYLVDRPSDLVLFYSKAPKKRSIAHRSFPLPELAPAPEIAVTNITDYQYSGSIPLDLLQAERVLELAHRMQAENYAPDSMREARITLGQARNYSKMPSQRRQMLDYARRSVTLSSEAMRAAEQAVQQQLVAEEAARRKAELDALADRAVGAEAAKQRAEQEKSELEKRTAATEEKLRKLRDQSDALAVEIDSLGLEKARLNEEMSALNAQRLELEGRLVAMDQERERLSTRLESALSLVAETRETARGYVLNLPDILFDLNQATLKPEAQIHLAKLTGILALMPELNLRVEGHTDSTGSEQYNQRLSELRALSVVDFLRQQGISDTRMVAAGYGWHQPVADNATAEGRSRNRRVEVVIAEGPIEEAQPTTQ